MTVTTPQVDTEIAETLQWIRQTMESGTDFLTDQAPLYADELLRYGWVSAWAFFWLSAIGIVAAIVAVVLSARRLSDDEYAVYPVLGLVIGGAIGIGSIAGVAESVNDLVKIKHAPRIYIVDHINR